MLSICYDYTTLETDNVLGLRVITEFKGILEWNSVCKHGYIKGMQST